VKTTSGAVSIPLSLRPKLEAALDAWQDWEGSDDNYVIKGDRQYSKAPTLSAKRLLRDVRDACKSAALAKRLSSLEPALVALLKTTPLDDLDHTALLDWIATRARLQFIDDFHGVASVDEAPLAAAVERAVRRAVQDDVSIGEFANRVVLAAEAWAKTRDVQTAPLQRFREDLEQAFGGVALYRSLERQERLAGELVGVVAAVLKVRWIQPPKPAQSYSPSQQFAVGDRLSHPKFGIGEVVRRLDGKIQVRFDQRMRTLAARTDPC
jgi:hypothetical protein